MAIYVFRIRRTPLDFEITQKSTKVFEKKFEELNILQLS